MLSVDTIKQTYPLHYLVWNNDYEGLTEVLKEGKTAVDSLDCRGRTPLMLCVTLGHVECARALLRAGANTLAENPSYWSVTQEATSTGDPELVQLILRHREMDAMRTQAQVVPRLLKKLRETPDFYVEMKWEFTSWIPLVSRMCPSDTYKVWKSGSNVRIDTTLVGFNSSSSWLRGNQSYIFRVTNNGAIIDEVDHNNRMVYRQVIRAAIDGDAVNVPLPSPDLVAQKLTRPVFTTYLDTENIVFERSKSGVWGWRSDKTEVINNRSCKVYSASNVNVVTKKRTEHLTDAEKAEFRRMEKEARGRNPLESFLSVAEKEEKANNPRANDTLLESESIYNPCQIPVEEYFDHRQILGGSNKRDIGRPQELTSKVQSFKAHLSLCDDYPLSLQEQVLPIIDLMAESNPHFKKLKDFVTLQLPTGFPMKVEIPLYHVMTAKITFENLFAADSPAPGVTNLRTSRPATPEPDAEEEQAVSAGVDAASLRNVEGMCCCVDETVFDIPKNYNVMVEAGGAFGHGGQVDDEEQMLQMALQKSIEDSPSQVSLPPAYFNEEEAMLQQAIAASLAETSCPDSDVVQVSSVEGPEFDVSQDSVSGDEQALEQALEMSRREQEDRERQLREEEEVLARILELSKLEQ